jgi:hypothetical protein
MPQPWARGLVRVNANGASLDVESLQQQRQEDRFFFFFFFFLL